MREPSDRAGTHFERPSHGSQPEKQESTNIIFVPKTVSIKLFDRRPRGPLNEYFNAINTEFCFKIDNRMKVSKELAGPDFCCVCVDKRFFVVCVDKRVQ